jgi:hypothetical protein
MGEARQLTMRNLYVLGQSEKMLPLGRQVCAQHRYLRSLTTVCISLHVTHRAANRVSLLSEA